MKSQPWTKASQPIRRTPVLIIALLAVTTALVFVVTKIAAVPISQVPGQEFDFGDIMIFISAWSFGPMIGGFSGGVGSAFSDATNGGVYAPFTLVIKGSEGFLAGFLTSRTRVKGRKLSWVLASAAMVGGYFLTNAYFIALFFGTNSQYNPGLINALIEVPFDFAQVLAGGIIGVPVSNYLRKYFPSGLFSPNLTSKGSEK